MTTAATCSPAHLPDAQLRIYPDAGHGFLDRYPEQFADHVNAFLIDGLRTTR